MNSSSIMHMKTQSNLLVCISYFEENFLTKFIKFRHDVRKNENKCTRCNISGNLFEVIVMGWLIVMCNTPLVF